MALLENSANQITFWSDIDNLLGSDSGGNISVVTEQTAVKQSIENILLTSKGERLLLRSFGSELEKYLFKGMTNTTKTMLISTLNKELLAYDTRAQVKNVEIVQDEGNSTMEIYMEVLVPKDNSSFVMLVS